MKFFDDLRLTDIKDLVLIGAVIYVLNWIWKNREKFDPTSDKNVAYQAASDTIRQLSNGAYQSVGDWLYSINPFEDDPFDPVVFSPYTKPDGTRGARVTRVVGLRSGRTFNIDYSGSSPRLIEVQP